jgi:hypothetical protein
VVGLFCLRLRASRMKFRCVCWSVLCLCAHCTGCDVYGTGRTIRLARPVAACVEAEVALHELKFDEVINNAI